MKARGYLIFALLVIGASTALAEDWNFQIIDNTGDVGKFTTIAHDSQGYPHVTYYDETNDRYMIASYVGENGWQLESVSDLDCDSSNGILCSWKHCAIAIVDDIVHVVYTCRSVYDNTSSTCYDDTTDYNELRDAYLLYKTKPVGGEWAFPQVVRKGEGTYSGSEYNGSWEAFGYPSILVSESRIDVVYFDGENNRESLWHAYKIGGGTWENQEIDPSHDVGKYNSIASDTNGNIFVSYYVESDSDVKLALYNGSNWSSFFVDGDGSDVGPWTSVAVDLDGVPHITYHESGVGLKHAAMSLALLRQHLNPEFKNNSVSYR